MLNIVQYIHTYRGKSPNREKKYRNRTENREKKIKRKKKVKMAETEGEHIDGACIKREETKRKGKEKEKKPRVQKRERECACAHEEERWRLPG